MYPAVVLQALPGAFPIFVMLIIFVTIAITYKSIVIIEPYNKAAYTRFGNYRGVLESGPNIIFPFITNIHQYDMRTQTLEVSSQDVPTRNNSHVSANVIVYMEVTDVEKAFLEVDNYERAVSNLVQTTLQAVLGDVELEDVLTDREPINAKICEELNESTKEWGIRVESVEISDINPAEEDQQQINQRNSDKKDVQQARGQQKFGGEFEAPLTLTESYSQGPFVCYTGTHDDVEEQIRAISLDPDVDSEEARDAFMSTVHDWRNGASHPNVVTIHDYGDSPRPWVVLPEEPGTGTLANQYQNLSLSACVDILVDVSEAVRDLTLYNTRHLNLSPGCVWVHESGESPDGVVDDWGLERSVREALNESHVTPYTAPEQIIGEQGISSARTDVYGLGAVTYYVVTEVPPMTADSQTIRQGKITPPSEIADVPEELSNVITHALSTDPDDRYDSAYEYGQALKTAIAHADES